MPKRVTKLRYSMHGPPKLMLDGEVKEDKINGVREAMILTVKEQQRSATVGPSLEKLPQMLCIETGETCGEAV